MKKPAQTGLAFLLRGRNIVQRTKTGHRTLKTGVIADTTTFQYRE
nr:hypothetical protein [Microbulbifer agarilyticus]